MLESYEKEGYTALAIDIVGSAVYDYLRARKQLERADRLQLDALRNARAMMRECEAFFRSEHCAGIYPGGPELLARLRKLAASEKFRSAKYVTKSMVKEAWTGDSQRVSEAGIQAKSEDTVRPAGAGRAAGAGRSGISAGNR